MHVPEPVPPSWELPDRRQEPPHTPLHMSPTASGNDVGVRRFVPPLRRKQRRGGRELVSSPQSRRWVGPIRRSWRPEGAAKNKRLTTGPLAGNSLHSAVRLRRLRPRGRPAAVSPTSRATGETSPRSRSNLALR